MPSFPIYVLQDGPDFYVYGDAERSNLLMTRTAPFQVGLDMDRAIRARQWFISLCSYNQVIIWPSAFE